MARERALAEFAGLRAYAAPMDSRDRRLVAPAPSSWRRLDLAVRRPGCRGSSRHRLTGSRGSPGDRRWRVADWGGSERRVDTNREADRRRASRSSRIRPNTNRSRNSRIPIRRRSTGSASSTPRSNRSGGCSTRPILHKSRSNTPTTLGRCSTSALTIGPARRCRPDRDRCAHTRRRAHDPLKRGCRIPRAWEVLVSARRTTTQEPTPAQIGRRGSRRREVVCSRPEQRRCRLFAGTRYQGWCRRWRRVGVARPRGRWFRSAPSRRILPRSATRGRLQREEAAKNGFFVDWT